MSPTPKKRAADTPGVQAAPPPIQAVVAPTPGATVDFTDQASFQEGVDRSPYATAKSAKRARKALESPAGAVKRARGKVAQPKSAARPAAQGTVDACPAADPATAHGAVAEAPAQERPHLRVVPDPGTGASRRPTAGQRGDVRGRTAAGKQFRPPVPADMRPETDLEQPLVGAPLTPGATTSEASASFRVIGPRDCEASARPSAGTRNIARPAPAKAPADKAPADDAAPNNEAARATGQPEGGEAVRVRPRHPVITADEPVRKPRKKPLDCLKQAFSSQASVQRFIVFVTCFLCVFLSAGALYGPSQELYLAYRLNERLQDELAMNQERVEALRSSVEALETLEGQQDLAHQTWGLVLPGEVYVNVVNASQPVEGNPIPPEVKRGSGQNTSSWVTDILDRFFASSNATSATEQQEQVATISEAGSDIS